MKKLELKIGDTVRAIFRKYGCHEVIGKIWDISVDEHALDGTWVSIKVSGGNMNDKQVAYMVANQINVMMPINDVKEIIK